VCISHDIAVKYYFLDPSTVVIFLIMNVITARVRLQLLTSNQAFLNGIVFRRWVFLLIGMVIETCMTVVFDVTIFIQSLIFAIFKFIVGLYSTSDELTVALGARIRWKYITSVK
jgi:hypothetical protein